MKITLNGVYILQDRNTGMAHKVEVIEITDKTILFKNLDNTTLPSLRVMNDYFDRFYVILEEINKQHVTI